MDDARLPNYDPANGRSAKRCKSMALPLVRLRSLSSRGGDEEKRREIRDGLFRLQSMQCHVPERSTVRRLEYGQSERRIPADSHTDPAAEIKATEGGQVYL